MYLEEKGGNCECNQSQHNPKHLAHTFKCIITYVHKTAHIQPSSDNIRRDIPN